jgi:hypothetical protein
MRRFTPFLLAAGGIIVVLILLGVVVQQHVYLFKQVAPDQVGVKIRGGQIADIVAPGVYSDLGLFVKLETYSTAEYRFSVSDPEVLTLDQQRLGVTVSGSVFRPDWTDAGKIRTLWTQYRSVFLSDEAIQRVMSDLSMQAMKVCVGDRLFSDAVVGSDRDALRQCINDELIKLTGPYGLRIANVVVPGVDLSPEVQAKLDAITQSRLDTEKAQQDEKKAIAQGKAQQAEQEAVIRVEQSRKQEQARQETTLAQLERDKLVAQQEVIGAQKANDLLAAQKELEIARAKAAAAAEQAKADLAQQSALAAMYTDFPNYFAYQVSLANASAIKETDKMIFTPEGVFPNLVFGSNVMSLVPFGPAAPETEAAAPQATPAP